MPLLAARCVWQRLPLLLVLDFALVVALLPAVLTVLAGLYLVAPIVVGLAVGPVWAAGVATTDRIVRGADVSVRGFGSAIRRFAGLGALLGAVAGLVASIGAGTLALWLANREQVWLLVPLFVDGTVLTLLALAGLSVFSLATTYGLRGWRLVRTSFAIVVAAPVSAVGMVALVALVVLAAQWLPSLIVIVAAPFAVFLSAYVHTSVDDGRDAAERDGA